MRKLLVVLILGVVLWSGYWFAGSTLLRQGAEDWFADQAAQGLTAEKTAFSVRGFPNRFDMRVEGLKLADPATGFGWQAPFAEVYSMTWKPWHIIAALPPEQVIRLPDQEVALASDRFFLSFRTRPASDLPLAAVIVETAALDATSTIGWTVKAGRSVASLSADEEVAGAGNAPNAYVLALDIADLAPDPVAVAKITLASGLPDRVAVVRLRAVATLTAALDRHAADTRPALKTLELTEALVTWGTLSLTAKGGLARDEDGFAAGRIEIAVTNWRPLVPALVAAGTIKKELALTVENMLAALAKESGNPDVLKLPLVMNGGYMSLGPLPLGPAPMLAGPSG